MTSVPHVVAYITPHGFGHAAIMTAVLRELYSLLGGRLRLTLVTTVPNFFFADRLKNIPYALVSHETGADFGMKMRSSTDVLLPESLLAYQASHQQWPATVHKEKELLASLQPSLVVSCCSYSSLAASKELHVPYASLGPFTWVDIFRHYCGTNTDASPVLQDMLEAYGGAEVLMGTEPALGCPHPDLAGIWKSVGPVALTPQESRETLRSRLLRACPEVGAQPVALLTMGGMADPLPPFWGRGKDGRWQWILPDLGAWQGERGVWSVTETGLSISELIACCDVVITKPGYGTFVEAACSGTPLLYRQRSDWPETEGLARWLAAYAPVMDVAVEAYRGHGEAVITCLEDLVKKRARQSWVPASPTGNQQAAEILRACLP